MSDRTQTVLDNYCCLYQYRYVTTKSNDKFYIKFLLCKIYETEQGYVTERGEAFAKADIPEEFVCS